MRYSRVIENVYNKNNGIFIVDNSSWEDIPDNREKTKHYTETMHDGKEVETRIYDRYTRDFRVREVTTIIKQNGEKEVFEDICVTRLLTENDWEKQRKRVAKVKHRIRRKVLDFQHTSWLTTEYEAVFVEDLDVKPMLEQSHNARNKQDAAWSQFIELLEYKADLNGCYVEKVEPENTTKKCSECGVKSDKPVWVRDVRRVGLNWTGIGMHQLMY